MEAKQSIVFFGSGAFGVPTLAALCAWHDVKAVVTQPDRPAGRGGALTQTAVAQWIGENNPAIPVLKPERVNDDTVVQTVRCFGAAHFVVIAFGQKIGRPLIEGVQAMNLHASLLPRWRGAAPINAAILAGDVETGNSVITLADRMDAGLVLGQSRRAIEPLQTAGELHDLLAQDGPALVLRVLEETRAGRLQGVVQDESRVTKASKLSKEDGWIDFSRTSEECRRRVHGLTPWPGVTVMFRGERLKLLRVRAEPGDLAVPYAASVNWYRRSVDAIGPGTILPRGGAEIGVVACGEQTCLQILEVQPAGKRPMPWHDFANGRAVKSEEVILGGRSTC